MFTMMTAFILNPLLYARGQAESGFSVGVDYFLPGNIDEAADKAEKDSKDIVNFFNGVPQSITESEGGIGARLKYMRSLSQNKLRMGGSFGYIKGPNTKSTVNDLNFPPGSLEVDFENTFIRVLFELEKLFSLSDFHIIKLGAGAGFGKGKSEQTFTYTGFYESFFLNSSESKSSTGFTWEVSPSMVFRTASVDLEFGVRYAKFPKIKESEFTYKVDYSGFGIFAGLGF